MPSAEKKVTGLLAFPVKASAKKAGGETEEAAEPEATSSSKELQLAKDAFEAAAEGDTDTAARSFIAAVKRCLANYG